MKVNSIKFKFCVLYVAILGLILVIYRSVLYYNLHHTLYNESEGQLRRKAYEISNTIKSYADSLGADKRAFIFAVRRVLRQEGSHPQQNRIGQLEQAWSRRMAELELKGDYINFLTDKGKLVVSSDNLEGELRNLFTKDIKEQDKESFGNIVFKKNNLNLRVINLPFTYREEGKFIIQVGTSFTPVVHALRGRLVRTAISIPIILLFAIVISLLLVTQILNPMVEITRTAKNISYENLSARVKVEKIDEEVKYLADAFNDMISRLEDSFKYIDEFNSLVAHELKTPLAIIKGEAELALRKERGAEEYRKALSINLEEADRMLKTINDLLLLAKLEYRSEAFKFEEVNFIEFLREIVEQGKILASRKDIMLNFDEPGIKIKINADKLHLRRLFFNLVDNAIKFTPANGKINLSVKREDKNVTVSIADTGPGIAEEDLPKLFSKFFRANNKGLNKKPGHGLGLNIAKSIAKIHDGDISVKSEFGVGSIFRVTLPLA